MTHMDMNNAPQMSGIKPASAYSSVARLSSQGRASERPTITTLSLPNDPEWLSPSMCLLREQIEVFAATHADIVDRRSGPKPFLGTVGLRCRHCVHLPSTCRSRGAVVYPKSISLMHQAVCNFQRYHFFKCSEIPQDTKELFTDFSPNEIQSKKGATAYWIRSCKDNFCMVDVEGDDIYAQPHVRFAPTKVAVETESSPEEQKMSSKKQPRCESSSDSSPYSSPPTETVSPVPSGMVATLAGSLPEDPRKQRIQNESLESISRNSLRGNPTAYMHGSFGASQGNPADFDSDDISPGKAAAFDRLDIDEDIEINDDHLNVHAHRQGGPSSSKQGKSPHEREYSSKSA